MSGAAQGDERARARTIVLRRLAAAPRSRAELARSLAEKDVPAGIAREVLDRYTELQLIDDQVYADLVVRSKQSAKGLARRGLAHELKRRGVGETEAGRALEQVDADLERTTARELVGRRMRSMARLDRPTATRRLVGMLARKGYDGGTAMGVVREALDQSHADEADGAWTDDGGVADEHPSSGVTG